MLFDILISGLAFYAGFALHALLSMRAVEERYSESAGTARSGRDQ